MINMHDMPKRINPLDPIDTQVVAMADNINALWDKYKVSSNEVESLSNNVTTLDDDIANLPIPSTPYSAAIPLALTGSAFSLNYNTSNFKITANKLNTIQDIAPTDTMNLGGLVVDGNISATGNVTGANLNISDWDTTYIIVQAGYADWDLAYAHISESGASHTYIDQAVTIAASPSFVGVTCSGLTPGQVIFPGVGGVLSGDSRCFWDNTNKRMGFGTSSPDETLEVAGRTILGAGFTDGQLQLVNTGATTDASWWFQIRDNGRFQLREAGPIPSSNRFCILSGGNAGFGTSNSTTNLHLYENTADTTPSFLIEQDGVGDCGMRYLLTGGQSYSSGIDVTDGYWKLNDGDTIGASSHFVMTPTGGIGIGLSPSFKLHSATSNADNITSLDTYDDGATYTSLRLRKSNSDTIGTVARTIDTNYLGEVLFYGCNDTGPSFVLGASIQAVQDGATAALAPTNLIFQTNSAVGINTNQFVLGKDGNSGFGTVAPTSLLEIYSATASPVLTITGIGYDPQTQYVTGTTTWSLGQDETDGALIIDNATNVSSSTPTMAFEIATGYVGMGTRPGAYSQLEMLCDTTNSFNKRCLYARRDSTVTTSGDRTAYALVFNAYEYGGGNNTGFVTGFYGSIWNRKTSGTITNLYGNWIRAGNYSGNGNTTNVKALYITPYHRVGIIGSYYDIFIDTPVQISGAATDDWCIYSEHSAPSRLIHELQIASDVYGFKLGASQNSSIIYNGTNMVVDPKLTDSGVFLHDTDSKACFRDTAIGIYSQADTFMDLFADGGIRIGDSSAGAPTNYAEFKPDGELNLHGTARVVKEIKTSIVSLAPGASGASQTSLGCNTGWSFNINDDMLTEFEIPFDWDSTTDLEVKVYWAIDEAYAANSGEVQWEVDWAATPSNETEPIDAPTHTGTIDFGDQDIPANAKYLTKTPGGAISAASLSAGDLVGICMRRVALDAGSNPAADPIAFHVEIEYVSDRLGEAT